MMVHSRTRVASGALTLVLGAIAIVASSCATADSATDGPTPKPSTSQASASSTSQTQTPTSISTPTPSTSQTSTSTTTEAPLNVATEICRGGATIAHRDISYDSIPGVAPRLLRLDVYEPQRAADCPPPPIMVYVHGGAWSFGNKTGTVDDKVSWFNEMGWVFVSVNYRLSPLTVGLNFDNLDPDRLIYPTHNNDVATSIAWVHDNAAQFGADSNAISIMGHSAGAAIVAAIATDETYMADHGLALDTIKCAVPLDTAAYDVRDRVEDTLTAGLYINAFGSDPEVWDDASPINHVEPGKGIPSFFIVTRGSVVRTSQAHDFADLLTSAGVVNVVVEPMELDHAGVNEAVGSPGDNLITPDLGPFLDLCGQR